MSQRLLPGARHRTWLHWTWPPPGSGEAIVGREGQELDELVARGDLLEDFPRLVVARAELRDLFLGHPLDLVARDLAVVEPLPDLRARDLGGRRVLHQVEDRDRPGPAQPRREVLDPDRDVVAEPVLRD